MNVKSIIFALMLTSKDNKRCSLAHPLGSMEREIEEQEVVIADDVRCFPVYGEPYVSQHFVLCLCHEGVSHGEYDMRPIEYRRHDFSVVYPNHTILANDSSDDYCVTLVIISARFYEQLLPRLAYGNSHMFYHQRKFNLTDEQYQCLCDVIRLLKSVNQIGLKNRKEMIANVIDLFSSLADEFQQKAIAASKMLLGKNLASPTNYFNRFYESLVNHYLESREVRFYAQQLCLSPKYFGTIIRKETGIGAGEWIARYVVIRAKTLLRHRPDLTIQQVCHHLGFSDAASFSRYFRTTAGMTAKAYREQMLK